MSRFLGEIRQFGYVVDDIEAGMKYWTEVMGVGPFNNVLIDNEEEKNEQNFSCRKI